MRILIHRQHRTLPGQARKLLDQHLERTLLPALRCKREGPVAVICGDPEHRRQQLRGFLKVGCRWRQQRLELVELGVGGVRAIEAGRAFEQADHRIERTVGVIR